MQNEQKRLNFVQQYINKPEVCFLKSDMSPRSYYRVKDQETAQSFILMDADFSENLDSFINISHYLNSIHIQAPKIIESDTEQGFLLLEDFGDQTLTTIFNDTPSLKYEQKLFEQAFDILHVIHEQIMDNPQPNLAPDYSLDLYIKEINVFAQYYFKYCHKKDMPDDIAIIWKQLWASAFNSIADLTPNTLVLRDYHVDNLMLLSDGSLGVLDFQDAALGSVMYDYISLVEDARRDLDQNLKEHLTNYFLKPFDTKYHQDYLHAADVLGAGRHAKVLGVFTRYSILHNNNEKLTHLPHTFHLLWRAIERAELHEIQYFIKDQGLQYK